MMDFNQLAEIFDKRADQIERWADRSHEYKIARTLRELADDIRTAATKAERLAEESEQ